MTISVLDRIATMEARPAQGMDDSGRVIYIGTFCKVLFPALRLGYVIVPQPLLARFLHHRDAFDLFSPTLYQSALADFIAQGHFARHVRRMRSTYQKRRDALVNVLNRVLGHQFEIVNADAFARGSRRASMTARLSSVPHFVVSGRSPSLHVSSIPTGGRALCSASEDRRKRRSIAPSRCCPKSSMTSLGRDQDVERSDGQKGARPL
jgi:Aminotransferase class I and II